MKWLAVRFKTPADADTHYGRMGVEVASQSVERLTISDSATCSTSTQTASMTEVVREWLKHLSEHDQLKTISELFQSYVLIYHSIRIPSDFLELSSQAMAQLKSHKRSNVLYKLAKSMGTLRPGVDDSCFPMDRMPMGLVEYIADFFVSDEVRKVRNVSSDLYTK